MYAMLCMWIELSFYYGSYKKIPGMPEPKKKDFDNMKGIKHYCLCLVAGPEKKKKTQVYLFIFLLNKNPSLAPACVINVLILKYRDI